MTPSIPTNYAPPADLLKDRVIVVTGAGDGLGRATAMACARHGAVVVLLGRTVARLEAVYDAIQAAGGPQPAIVPLNLATATWNDYTECARTLEREFGALHGLVHCAAHFKSFTPLSELDPRDWIEGLQVNLTAAYSLTRHCLPLLRKADAASVVFVSDAAGRDARAFTGAYGVAKLALEGLMKIWSKELEAEHKVRLNTFDPGPMKTALRRRGYVADVGNPREPDAVAPSMLWLLGADSKGVTGQSLGGT